MDIFEVTKTFPVEEKYSLTDQIQRSSRSVCASIAESYRKRRYKAHFISKLSDADMENSGTIVCLDFALSCGYITEDIHCEMKNDSDEIGKLLNHMMQFPDKFINFD